MRRCVQFSNDHNSGTHISRRVNMAVSQADIDALNAAIASGERQVTIGSQSVTYRSIDDLIKARDDLQAQIDAQAGKTRNRQIRLYYAGRGHE